MSFILYNTPFLNVISSFAMIRTQIKSLLKQLSFLNKKNQDFLRLLDDSKPAKLNKKEVCDALLESVDNADNKMIPLYHNFNFFNSDLNQMYLPLSKTNKSPENVEKFSK